MGTSPSTESRTITLGWRANTAPSSHAAAVGDGGAQLGSIGGAVVGVRIGGGGGSAYGDVALDSAPPPPELKLSLAGSPAGSASTVGSVRPGCKP